MEAAVTTPSTGKTWRRLAITLVAFIIIPLFPSQIQLILPIVETPLLLVPVIAACAIVGWLAGGKPVLAVVWLMLAAWFLLAPVGPAGSPYDGMARGWALLLAGSFGLMNLSSSAAPFIVRALGALGLATGTAFILAISTPGGLDRYEKVAASEFTRRGTSIVAMIQTGSGTKEYRDFLAKSPALAEAFEDSETQLKSIPPRSAALLPALLALESLAALALGWALYTRMSPQQIGPPLGKLKEFRFSDQLVWGVAVGGTLLMLPAFEEGRNAGLNLLLFFGLLYLVRGFGVMAWMTSGRRKILLGAFITAFLIFVIAPAIGALLLALLIWAMLGTAMVLGLGDTWLDWRSRPAAG
jgi:hypothetical protein